MLFNKDPQNQSGTSASGMTTQNDAKGKDRQLAIMLVLVSFALLVLTLPIHIHHVVWSVINPAQSPDTFAQYALSAHMTSKIFIVNNACNFFLYSLGGQKFRQDLIHLCHRSKANGKSSRFTSISNTASVTSGNHNDT